MKKMRLYRWGILFLGVFLLTGCSEDRSIVNGIDEREANEIIVFLASKGILGNKVQAAGGEAPEGGVANLWNISVNTDQAIDAMALLNHNGLPRRKGSTLLELFAKQGLMTSDKEETIRYQAGVEEELKNIIRKIDGILDADVQISFPSFEEQGAGGTLPKMKAAVYVKHQGIFDDPNHHLETKIKRLLAGSVPGLSFENVSVIADRSRFTEIQLQSESEKISADVREKEYVSIWSIIMTKGSLSRFRFLFFTLLFCIIGLGGILGFLVYKFYPDFRKRLLKKEKREEEESKELK